MHLIKHLLKKIYTWIKSFFTTSLVKKSLLRNDLIGLGQFGAHKYYFIRRNQGVFLVSQSIHKPVSKQIFFSPVLTRYIDTMQDLHALEVAPGDYALVCTIRVGGQYKTVYLTSQDSIHYQAESMVWSPDGSPSKLVVMRSGQVAVLTSIDGEICYRNINLSDREIHYHKTQLAPRDNSFDHAPLKITGVRDLDEGIFVLYEASYEFPGYQTHRFGGALLNHDNLSHMHWRAFHDEVPFWENFISRTESSIDLESQGVYFDESDLEIIFKDKKNGDIYGVSLHQPYARIRVSTQKAHLKKYINNPILRPDTNHNWECHTVLNPAAIQIDNVTHLLYRAEGSAGLSVVGYGKSYNGVTFERYADPVYVPRMDFEGVNVPEHIKKIHIRGSFKSGYNHYSNSSGINNIPEWHGVEDPRVTEMEGRLYMIYAAYNGYQMARPAITSISKQDFLNQYWNWTIPSPMTDVPQTHGEGNKNVVLHPEKVDGKYMLYHRIWPHIRIDYVNDLEFGPGKKYLKELDRISARGDSWDSHKIAVAAPPILIDEGWLLIYQGAGSQDRKYKVGAMILDRTNPSRVLYRSSHPILEPSEWYENEHKFGIAYPCGAVVRDGILNVYYGGSDKYVCLAQSPLHEFIEKLKQDPYCKPSLTKKTNLKELCI